MRLFSNQIGYKYYVKIEDKFKDWWHVETDISGGPFDACGEVGGNNLTMKRSTDLLASAWFLEIQVWNDGTYNICLQSFFPPSDLSSLYTLAAGSSPPNLEIIPGRRLNKPANINSKYKYQRAKRSVVCVLVERHIFFKYTVIPRILADRELNQFLSLVKMLCFFLQISMWLLNF